VAAWVADALGAETSDVTVVLRGAGQRCQGRGVKSRELERMRGISPGPTLKP